MWGLRGAAGVAIAVTVAALFGWGRLQRAGQEPNEKADQLPAGVKWSQEFDTVADLAAVGSVVVASVVSAAQPFLVGLDAVGRLKWRLELPGRAMLVSGPRSVFVTVANRLMTIDPANGTVTARKDIESPLTTRSVPVGEDLLIGSAGVIERVSGVDLQTVWRLDMVREDGGDSVQQLAHETPWIVAVSNRKVLVLSEDGRLVLKKQLPADRRLAGDHPLVLVDGRVWVGLAGLSEPTARCLYGFSALDGSAEAEAPIGDLALFCPAHVSNGVLALDTQNGLAGFDVAKGLTRSWSIELPIAPGACIAEAGQLVVGTRTGELVRVTVADGKTRTLLRLSRKSVWTPPAPDLPPGLHVESVGRFDHLASLPRGVAVSVTGPGARVGILGATAARAGRDCARRRCKTRYCATSVGRGVKT